MTDEKKTEKTTTVTPTEAPKNDTLMIMGVVAVLVVIVSLALYQRRVAIPVVTIGTNTVELVADTNTVDTNTVDTNAVEIVEDTNTPAAVVDTNVVTE